MSKANGENPAAVEIDRLSEMLTFIAVLAEEIGLTSRDVSTIRTRTMNEGISFLTKTLPLLTKALDKGLGSCVFELPSNFKKRWRGSEIPAFCGSLFSLVFEKDGRLKEDASFVAIKSLRQIGFLFYKFVLPFSEDCEQAVLEEFISTDQQITSFPDTSVAQLARRFTTSIFGEGFDPLDLNFSHGPGVVSDLTHNFEKFENEFDPSNVVVKHFGLSRYNEVYGDKEHNLSKHFKTLSGFCSTQPVAGSKPAKVILVPKDSRGPRIISCEPSVKQFAQQGIRKWTQTRLESHPITKGYVNFESQDVNRNLVLAASVDKSYSTLDLKSASDLISLECVQYLFEHVPIYLNSLLSCRSSHTEIQLSSGEVRLLHMRKFAPMGSAVCFTTLAWVVYALAYSAILQSGHDISGLKKALYVYGDDIIVETRFASLVMDTLENHGLKINKGKSFVNSNFLESCGMDAFKGFPVAPVRARALLLLSNRPKTGEELGYKLRDPEFASDVVKTVELANNMAVDYPSTAEHLYKVVEFVLKRPLPFGTEHSGFLCRRMPSTEIAWSLNSLRVHGRIIQPELHSVRALQVVTLKTRYDESGFGRLRRVLPMMGSECRIPCIGEIDKSRRYTLRTCTLTPWYRGAYTAKRISH